jgi:membrane protease YdiL (CAAX protease family)
MTTVPGPAVDNPDTSGKVVSPEPEPRAPRLSIISHVVPFVLWLALMMVLNKYGPAGAWKYALRTGLCLVLFLVLRPWRWYEPLRIRNLGWALLTGVVVLIAWVGPELGGSNGYPLVQELYLRFGILPLGRIPEAGSSSMYAPEVCGWTLSLVRLAGSAFVIAIIEEFFWRGFLYRWIMDRNFLRVKLNAFDWEAFLIVAVLFGFEHNRWLAGIVAGVCYALLLIKTRDIWATAIAHIITNFLLGLYVIATGSYVFW